MDAGTVPALANADDADDADDAAIANAGPEIAGSSVAESAVAASAVVTSAVAAPTAAAPTAPTAAAPAAVAWPAMPAADAFFGECIIDRYEQSPGRHHVQWYHEWERVTRGKYGITGWAKVLHTTNPTLAVGGIFRFHKCFHNPCQADWTQSRYGHMPIPIHLQPYEPAAAVAETPLATAVAELAATIAPPESLVPAVEDASAIIVEPIADAPASEMINTAAAEAPAAVAEPPGDEEQVGLTPAQPEGIEDVPSPLPPPSDLPPPPPSDPPPPAFPPPIKTQVCASAAPTNAKHLLGMCPPLPVSPMPLPLIHATAIRPADESAVAARSSVLHTVLALAREIRRPKEYVGYAAFILMALANRVRPVVWEGTAQIDLVEVYAPWALESCSEACAVDVVCCALEPQSRGHARLCAIGDDMGLAQCRHFVAAAEWPEALIADPAVADTLNGPTAFEKMYHKQSRVIIPTVLDGDCGFDVMTKMLGLPQTYHARTQLRTEISDYLIARAEEPWMHDLLACCGELDNKVVALAREGPGAGDGAAAAAVAESAPTAPAAPVAEAEAVMPEAPSEDVIEALRWSTGLKDAGVLCNLAHQLPPEIVNEQVASYKEANGLAAVAGSAVYAGKLKVTTCVSFSRRMEVAYAFDKYCERNLIDPNTARQRELEHFIRTELQWERRGLKPYVAVKAVRRWYAAWVHTPKTLLGQASGNLERRGGGRKRHARKMRLQMRKRGWGGGRKRKGYLIGKELYEWWTGMRYAIDWNGLSKFNRSRGKKCLARFPRSVLRAKVLQLIEDHAYAALVNGCKPAAFVPTSHWFKSWENDYGLTMR